MTFKEMALHMYQYWILGAGVLLATYISGNKDAIRVEKKAVFDFVRFLGIITLYRILLFKLFPHNFEEAARNMSIIPWPATLTVFWEDACHGLPLYLLQKFTGMDKWWKKAFNYGLMGVVMLEFGLGHVYQGVFAACLLSLYIPYSIRLGKKYGFGTVMIGHTIFDLTTILTMKALFGV